MDPKDEKLFVALGTRLAADPSLAAVLNLSPVGVEKVLIDVLNAQIKS